MSCAPDQNTQHTYLLWVFLSFILLKTIKFEFIFLNVCLFNYVLFFQHVLLKTDEAFYFSNLFLRGIQIIVDEILIIKFLNYCIFFEQTFFQGSKRLQMIYLHRFGNGFLCNVPQDHILRRFIAFF